MPTVCSSMRNLGPAKGVSGRDWVGRARGGAGRFGEARWLVLGAVEVARGEGGGGGWSFSE
jgi:hypothetical protein